MNLHTKEEIIAAIKEIAARLGRTPIYPELRSSLNLTEYEFRRLFGSYNGALKACGLPASYNSVRTPLEVLFRQWAATVRKLGRIPTMAEYEYEGFSSWPIRRRFSLWSRLPRTMKRYGEQHRLWAEWPDVLEILNWAKEPENERTVPETREKAAPAATLELDAEDPWTVPGAPIFGEPVASRAVLLAPKNEGGVMVLFGSLAAELGYFILHIQNGFPDCIALRRVHGGGCQLVKIELEYESRNFLKHGHDPAGCDMIVCWIHNWPECPVRVLELSKLVGRR